MTKTEPENRIKKRIMQISRELYARYGFRKTTLNDIARELGMTKSSIYYYFGNKEEIFNQMISSDIEKWKKELSDFVGRQDSVQEKLAAYITRKMEIVCSISDFYRSPIEEYHENFSLIEKLRAETDKEEIGIIKEILGEGNRQGVFNVQDIDMTALNMLNILKGLEHYYIGRKKGRNLKKTMENMVSLFLNGLIKR
jgi:AcrR family transcriptional regulator